MWYLPHHPVLKPKKTQKIRVASDCAAKCAGIALNDRLLQSPDPTTPPIEVLCRFRLGSVAVAADIEEMFMQVKVPEGQRSFDNIEEAVRHVRDLSKVLLMGGLKLTKWMSNSRHAIDCIPVDERAPSLRELQGSPLQKDRALGVQWDSEKDEFLFQLQLPETTATRRGILFSLASLYDAMGFVAPWLLPGKILLQDLCRKRVRPYARRITRPGKAGS
ncbi:unnamed protein product [Echinostoma caproni]|uniref:Uncharacterized protein n=1 Tax=Echinostoma caproni TaxID=27848 RepID=A0A3P8GMU3_9TREM|nr:unnamed protein product [Echinostoma caproni]